MSQSVIKPKTIKELAQEGQMVDFDSSFPLIRWIEIAKTIVRQADVYDSENDYEEAYRLYSRFADITLNFLPTHPEASLGKNKARLMKLNVEVNRSMDKMAKLKPIINQRVAAYNLHVKMEANRIKHQQQAQQRNLELHRQRNLEYHRQEHQRRSSYSISDSDYDQALKDIQTLQKTSSSSASVQSDVSRFSLTPTTANDQASSNSSAKTVVPSYPLVAYKPSAVPQPQTPTVDTRPPQLPPQLPPHPDVNPEDRTLNAHSSVRGPSNGPDLVSSHTGTHRPSSIYSFADSTYSLPSSIMTATDVKPLSFQQLEPDKAPGSLQPKASPTPSAATLSNDTATTATSNTNNEATHKIRSHTEGGTPLRSVFLPNALRVDFLNVALSNTRRRLETCGMLCGKLSRNAFFITHLIIPHQESTPDTCQTTHEELLFEYLDTHDLILLGWIHTHPTQSCFMSSVDLHTQGSYQLMLRESIAIVCAPSRDHSWDIYRLTDPNGISIIKKCPKSSFHPHPEPDLYASSMVHGHVVMSNNLPFKIVDLRSITPED